MMNEQWIQQMRQKMADYKRPAPEVSWEKLDEALVAGAARKARMLWLQRMAMAAVLLLIVGFGYWGIHHQDVVPVAGKQIVQELPTEKHAGIEHDPVPQNIGFVPMVVVPSVHTSYVISQQELEPEVTPSFPTVFPDTLTATVTEDVEQLPTEEEKVKAADHPQSVIFRSDFPHRKPIENRLTAKVYISSTMADNRYTETNSLQEGPIVGEYTNPNVINHRSPVRLGISLRYQITNRWGVESGLTYTHLSSDISTVKDDVITTSNLRLNYIGLPVNVSYNLWKIRHFSFYVITGVTIEKQLDVGHWLFSLNGAVGTAYKLTDFASLYAEPGFGYYFNDTNTTPTIYHERPLNFNLSVGLRFNLK